MKTFMKKYEGQDLIEMQDQINTVRSFPTLKSLLTNKLTDKKFVNDTFDDWCEVMNNPDFNQQFRILSQSLTRET